MQLAVSNIAWGDQNFSEYLHLLKALGCDGVEIAPGLIWQEPVEATPSQRREYRSRIEDSGLAAVGLHSLLFTRPDLVFFGEAAARHKLADYIIRLVALCNDLGGKTLIFGSPSNRRRAGLHLEEATRIAAPVFRTIAEAAQALDVFLCIEPLGPEETDFINSSEEGMDLIRLVGHPHFRLHLDAKALISSQEDCAEVLNKYGSHLRHFHAGDPGVAPPGSTGADHHSIGKALRKAGYPYYISIEMRSGFGPVRLTIEQSVDYVKRCYFANGEAAR